MLKEHEQIKQVASNCWRLFCGLFPELKERPEPVIAFDKRVKKVWAYAYGDHTIRFNYVDSIKHVRLYLSDIIGHEVAHIVQGHLYEETAEHHGKEWQELMRMIGLEPLTHYDAR